MTREEVQIALSGALFGGDPRGLIDHFGLHGRPLDNDRWAVWPSNDRAFISHHGLADETEFANRFDHLKQVPMTAAHLVDDPEALERFSELESQLRWRRLHADLPYIGGQIDSTRCSDTSVIQRHSATSTAFTIPTNTSTGFLHSARCSASPLRYRLLVATTLSNER